MVRERGGDVFSVRDAPFAIDHLSRPSRWLGLEQPAIMGIVNVTPDSFSDGGREDPVAHGRRLRAEGATILDIGGESTRPGANPVTPDEEQRRIIPVVARLAADGALISVDTRHAATMAAALDAGAAIVNDVSALRHDPAALAVVAASGCPVVLMHMRGTPQTMTGLTHYDDVAFDVVAELSDRVDACVAAGIDRTRIAIDPGFGFAKTPAQSRELLQRLPLFFNLCCRIIAGLSRKRFIGEIAGVGVAQERDAASVAAGVLALSLGAAVLRVHDVAATAQAIRVWQAVNAGPDAKRGTMA